MRRTKIAVTGASGFIGRHVLAALRGHDVDVVALTRNATDLAGVGSLTGIVEMDIAAAGKGAFDKLGRPDILIHLAWGGLPDYKSSYHLETELPRQFRFIKNLVEAGLRSVLVTGTCLEYGMQSGQLSEELETKPGIPYGYAKDTLRRQLQSLKSERPFTLTWARLFYMYGEGQPASSLYPQLRDAVLRGEPVFNMSGGEQLRDYLPVEEVGRLISILAQHRYDVGCVNVCSGKAIAVRSLVESWIEANEWSIELNPGYYPYPDYEPMEFWGDRKKLDRLLALP